MGFNRYLTTVVASVGLLALGLAAGCDNDASTTETAPAQQPTASSEQPKPAPKPLIQPTQIADWCPEHGVPESVCTRCNDSLTAGFKEKGDWCKEHNLPDSQCFVHHPELKEKFAAAYREKYGKEPPAASEGEHEHEHEKKEGA